MVYVYSCYMQIIERYPYRAIKRKRVEGKRLYDTETGFLPSVTTILDKTKPQEAVDALANWRNRVGHDEAARITTEAANVGTIMHNSLEAWLKNEPEPPGDNIVHRVGKRMAQVVIDNISNDLTEVWGSEVGLYYPGLYAGTTDLLGIWKGRPAIMDFKQSNKPKRSEWVEDYRLQGVAYALAHNALFDTDIKNVAIFICTRDCDFQLFEVGGDQFDECASKWAVRVGEFYELDK
jgi:ATP-dependent exoDNAse (exonuclease V) beta subunit